VCVMRKGVEIYVNYIRCPKGEEMLDIQVCQEGTEMILRRWCRIPFETRNHCKISEENQRKTFNSPTSDPSSAPPPSSTPHPGYFDP